MGKGSPKPPAAPDPAKTAAAQTATNKETAYWNAVLNNVNQITPYGNLTYEQTGGGKQYNMDAYNKALDSFNTPSMQQVRNPETGRMETVPVRRNQRDMPKLADFLISDTPPQFTSTINLTPESQRLLDTQLRSENALAGLGEGQIGRIGESVAAPYSFAGLPEAYGASDRAGAATRAEEALLSRLNPQFQRDEEALRTRLQNQGIGFGSEAYNREFERFDQARNDARMQAILQGANYGGVLQDQSLRARNQAIQEYNAQRNAPLNEYVAITAGQQVQNPAFQSTGYQGTAPVDYAGLLNNQYQGQLNAYNQKVAGQNATQSSLFGLAGSALGGFLGGPAGASFGGWLFGG